MGDNPSMRPTPFSSSLGKFLNDKMGQPTNGLLNKSMGKRSMEMAANFQNPKDLLNNLPLSNQIPFSSPTGSVQGNCTSTTYSV